jgi:hypothetical protein
MDKEGWSWSEECPQSPVVSLVSNSLPWLSLKTPGTVSCLKGIDTCKRSFEIGSYLGKGVIQTLNIDMKITFDGKESPLKGVLDCNSIPFTKPIHDSVTRVALTQNTPVTIDTIPFKKSVTEWQ